MTGVIGEAKVSRKREHALGVRLDALQRVDADVAPRELPAHLLELAFQLPESALVSIAEHTLQAGLREHRVMLAHAGRVRSSPSVWRGQEVAERARPDGESGGDPLQQRVEVGQRILPAPGVAPLPGEVERLPGLEADRVQA